MKCFFFKKPSRKRTQFKRQVLNAEHCDPDAQLDIEKIVVRIIVLAQAMIEKAFYPYQVEYCSAIVRAVLRHDGETLTCLMSRQAGKSLSTGATLAAVALIFPKLALLYPKSWHLNITDDRGVYRGFRHGIMIGIYAGRKNQAEIIFEHIKAAFETNTSLKILAELGNLTSKISNGNRYKLSNGSVVLCESASEQSKIEGKTHHVLIVDEAQDVTDLQLTKSLLPMVSSYNGSIILIGTASTRKCYFYKKLIANQRLELLGGRRNHYFYPYTVTQQYNSQYKQYIERQKLDLGENSDEFLMSYAGVWLFERGMFITAQQLFHPETAIKQGLFGHYYSCENYPPFFRSYAVVIGIDWGRSLDSTFVCFMLVDWVNPLAEGYTFDSEGRHEFLHFKKHLIGWMSFTGDDYETQYTAIKDVIERTPFVRKVVMDANTCGLPMYDRILADFANRDIQFEAFNFQPRIKSEGYRLLYADLLAHRLTIPADASVQQNHEHRMFIKQMLDLQKEWKGNIMSVHHPEEKGAHDDAPDAFMMANWGARVPAASKVVDSLAYNPFFE